MADNWIKQLAGALFKGSPKPVKESWVDHLKADLHHDEGGPYLHAYPDPLSPMGKRLGYGGIVNCGRTGYLPPQEKSRLSEGAPWTIGYGRARGIKYGDKITKEQADAWFHEDVTSAINDAAIVLGPSWQSLSGPRKAVLANMAYNLGREKLSEFNMTLNFVRRGLFDMAAIQMGRSLWARQLPKRSKRLIAQMNTGVYQKRV